MGVREGQWLRGAQAQGVRVITAQTACARSDTRVHSLHPMPHRYTPYTIRQSHTKTKGASHIIIKLKPEQFVKKTNTKWHLSI